MVFDIFAEFGCVQVFAAIVFGAVGRPMRRFNRPAVCRADEPPIHQWDPPVVLLRGPLGVLLGLGTVAHPLRGAHQFPAFVLNVFVAVVFGGRAPQLVVDRCLFGSGHSFALFLTLAGPPNAHHDAEEPQDAEDATQHWHQVIDGRSLGGHLHFNLDDGQHDGAVVAFGQSVNDDAGSSLDLTSICLLRPTVCLKGHGDLHGVAVGVRQVTEDHQRSIFGQSLSLGEIPQLRTDVLHCRALRHCVLLEYERDASAVVVQESAVGLTLSIQG